MQVVAGPRGCKEYRDGKLTFIPPGRPVPEMLKLSYNDLKRRERLGLIIVKWDEGDPLLSVAADSPRTIAPPRTASDPGDFAPRSGPAAEPQKLRIALDAVRASVMKTTRGFTEHLTFPGNDGAFLCGTRIEADMIREGIADAKSCARCARRFEDLERETV